MQQKEDVFIKIRKFNRTLKSYNRLCVLSPADLNRYGIIWVSDMDITDDAIMKAIDSERTEIENHLYQNDSEEKEEINKEVFQLNVAYKIVAARKRLCELFEEICPGKRLLIF